MELRLFVPCLLQRKAATSRRRTTQRLLAVSFSIAGLMTTSAAQAAECSEASPEPFNAFLSTFSTHVAFVLARTDFPLYERQWADEDWLEDSPSFTERWVTRETYARRPPLQTRAQQGGLTIDVAASTRTSATVELRDHLRFPVRAYHFNIEQGCWRLVNEDVFEQR